MLGFFSRWQMGRQKENPTENTDKGFASIKRLRLLHSWDGEIGGKNAHKQEKICFHYGKKKNLEEYVEGKRNGR